MSVFLNPAMDPPTQAFTRVVIGPFAPREAFASLVPPPRQNHEKQHLLYHKQKGEVMPVVRAKYHHCSRLAIAASQLAIPVLRFTA